MNSNDVKVGQVWQIKESSKRERRDNSITVNYVSGDYFTYKEDVTFGSWHFDLLKDHYILVSE
jgi:hypothetical protein